MIIPSHGWISPFCVGVVNESTEAKDFVAYAPPILGPRWMQGNGFWVLASKDDVDVSFFFFRDWAFNPFFIKRKKAKCPSYTSDPQRWRGAIVNESQQP
jgi:hypothetical protein